MVSTQKKSQVDSLVNLLKEKDNFVLVKVGKTTHQSLENLRKELKKTDSSFKVIKNTLFEKALNRASENKPLFKDLKKKFFPLRESSAILTLTSDWSRGLKTFYEFIQKEKTLSFKLALLDNLVYNHEDAEKIAKLPGRDELVAKIIGSLKSPMNKFVFALKYNTNKFVHILKVKGQKQN